MRKQLAFKLPSKNHRPGTKVQLITKYQCFGGLLNHRKYKRPFNQKRAVHIVIRSRLLSGSRSLLKGNRRFWIEKLIKTKAKKRSAILYKVSVNSNHIHLLMKFHSQELQGLFLREISGSMAIKIKKAFKIAKFISVWDSRPFTTIARHFPQAKKYIEKNQSESTGNMSYQNRPVSYLIKSIAKIYSINPNILLSS